MERPRVLLADDHTLLLEAFEKLLEPECEIVGKVADGRALLAAAPELRPDLIVLDISMPRISRTSLIRSPADADSVGTISSNARVEFVSMNERRSSG